jgi:hypothetical protein
MISSNSSVRHFELYGYKTALSMVRAPPTKMPSRPSQHMLESKGPRCKTGTWGTQHLAVILVGYVADKGLLPQA